MITLHIGNGSDHGVTTYYMGKITYNIFTYIHYFTEVRLCTRDLYKTTINAPRKAKSNAFNMLYEDV